MKTGKLEDILGCLKPGQRVYVQGGPGECALLTLLLRAYPEAARCVELWSCLVPGINSFDYGSLPNGPSLTTFMASPALEPSIATGRTRLEAMPYSQIGAKLASTEFDLAILHTSLPKNGACSFGISSEAAALVWPRAKKRIAFLNHRMPHVKGDCIPAETIDLAIETDEPPNGPRAFVSHAAELKALARHAARLVPDGATIQSGIGAAPEAMVSNLMRHRRLRIHSGLVGAEYRLLAESGALDAAAEHIAGIAWGDARFYNWLPDSGFVFRSVAVTHAHERLAAIPNFVSLGSALEVDLEGNLNLEWLDGRRVSSVGGAPDFMAGAAASPGGRSIIALPSSSRSGRSRIVPRIEKPSIPASLADAIVTEHGVADLRGLSRNKRAEALIAVAAPEHRAALEAARRV